MSARDELAKVLGEHDGAFCICGALTTNPEQHQADAILASDWLAAHVRAKQAEALREAAEDLAPRALRTEPCAEAESCCGSTGSCDAVRPIGRLVGPGWLRDRADRIGGDQ